LAALCRRLMVQEMRFSDAVVGAGRALYAAVVAQGHEGVMAKHLGVAVPSRSALGGLAENQAAATGDL